MKVICLTALAILISTAANAERLSCPKGSTNIALFDGNPKEQAMLKPDNGDQQADKYVYTLDKKNKRGYWLTCQYPGAEMPLQQKFRKKSFSSCSSFQKDGKFMMSCK